MRESNKRTFIIIALVVTVLFIGIGYAALRQTLIINGTGSIGDATWNVQITDISDGTLNGATDVAPPSSTATSATFSANLQYPGASATYEISIANTGSIAAKLESITGVDTANAAEPSQIQFEVTGVKVGDTLAATNGTATAIVTVKWVAGEGENSDVIPETKTKTATINLNYVQDPNPDAQAGE